MDENGKKKRSPYFKIGVYTFFVGAGLLLFNRLLDSMGDLLGWISGACSAALTTMMPFIIAIVLAYLFRPLQHKLMKLLEKFDPGEDTKKRRLCAALRRRMVNKRRFVAASILYIIFIALIIITLAYVLPSVVHNLVDLGRNMPEYVSALLNWVRENVINNEELPAELRQVVENGVQNLNTSINSLLKEAVSMIPMIVRQIYAASSMSLNILLAFVLSFYLVCDEGKLFVNVTRWLGDRLGPRRSRKFFGFLSDLDFMFSKYLVGRMFESLIVAGLCFGILMVLGLPYNALLSAFYGFTNMIPYVGPVVGLIPVVCVALFRSPTTALLAAALLTVVQSFDAWVLSPKVLGDSMGLNPFWIIFALVIGGALFGVVGLLLSTPVMGVLMRMLDRQVKEHNEISEDMLNPMK